MLKNYLRYRMADKEMNYIVELMQLSGVSRNSINKLIRNENVETIKLSTLIKLCDALECDLADLVEYKYQ